MSIKYAVKESISCFTRAKLSTLISIFTIAISLLLLGVFAIMTINAAKFIEFIRNKVEMEAFLQEPVTRQDVNTLEKRLLSIEGVSRVVHVSKEEAVKIFKQEFGEDINSVLDFNPLPPSFKIYLKDGYKTAVKAELVYNELAKLKSVDTVVYKKALLGLIDEQKTSVNNLTLGLGILVSLSAIFLVSNTIRLAIYAKRRLIRTMELVGATAGFIKLPFLLEGIVQGFLGGLISAVILYALLEYAAPFVSLDFASFIRVEALFYWAVVGTGIILGLLGSIISIFRFIRLGKAAKN